tara:strand:+ start:182 stop:829 length:648 start_codon:yes stop_codon:yes gene_type:complete
MTKIFYVDKKMKVIRRRNTKRKNMDWSGGISITITKAELTAWMGPTIWDPVYDVDRHPAFKMRGGKIKTERQLILNGTITENHFLREDGGYDENRLTNKEIKLDVTGYHGIPHQLGTIGGFSCYEESGLHMSLYLPNDMVQFIYCNKRHYEKFEMWFGLNRKWGNPEAPEDFEEPYYKDPNNFRCDASTCGIVFTDEFGNKKEKTNKTTKQKTAS